MHDRISALKGPVRAFMFNKYGWFLSVLIVYGIIQLVVGFLPSSVFPGFTTFQIIGSLGLSFILNAFYTMASMGVTKAAFDVQAGIRPTVAKSLLYPFKHSTDKFLIIALILTLVKTIFTAPVIAASFYFSDKEVSFFFYEGIAVVGALIAEFFSTIVTLKITWAYYFMIEDSSISVGESLKRSIAFSKGRTLEVFYLKLSFIGLEILSVMSMYVGFLYTVPYAEMTYLRYYLENK